MWFAMFITFFITFLFMMIHCGCNVESEVWIVLPANIYRAIPSKMWHIMNSLPFGVRVVRWHGALQLRIPPVPMSVCGVLIFRTYTDFVGNRAVSDFLDYCISNNSTLFWTGALAHENDFFVRPYEFHFLVNTRNYNRLISSIVKGNWNRVLEWSAQVDTQCFVPLFMSQELQLNTVDVFIRSNYPTFFAYPVAIKLHLYIIPDNFTDPIYCPTPIIGSLTTFYHTNFLKSVQNFNGYTRCYSHMRRSQKMQILMCTSDIEFVVPRTRTLSSYVQISPYDLYEWMQYFTLRPRMVTMHHVTDPSVDMCSLCFQSTVELEKEADENVMKVQRILPGNFEFVHFIHDVNERMPSYVENFSANLFRFKCGCNVNYCISCFLQLANHEMINSSNLYTKLKCNYCKCETHHATEQVSELLLYNMFGLCERKQECWMPGDK
jgi:hypothetical protein